MRGFIQHSSLSYQNPVIHQPEVFLLAIYSGREGEEKNSMGESASGVGTKAEN